MRGNNAEARGRGAREWLLPFAEERASWAMAGDATVQPDGVPAIEGFVSAI